jgi:hypothetical protein
MSKKIDNADKGFFSMDDVRAIEKLSINDAKKYSKDKIAAMPNARPNNIKKATEAVDKARSVVALMQTMTNFLLAHPSEGLGMGDA